jgi:hypothetical protein
MAAMELPVVRHHRPDEEPDVTSGPSTNGGRRSSPTVLATARAAGWPATPAPSARPSSRTCSGWSADGRQEGTAHAPPAELTAYQADQLARLTDQIERYPNPSHPGALCVVARQGVQEREVPPVWRQLADLGVVEVTRRTDRILVRPKDEG